MSDFNPCDRCAYEMVKEHRACLECTYGDKYQVQICDLCKNFRECECSQHLECVNGSKFELHRVLSCEGCKRIPPSGIGGGYNCRLHHACIDGSAFIGDSISNIPEEYKLFLEGRIIEHISKARNEKGIKNIELVLWYTKQWIEVVKNAGKV